MAFLYESTAQGTAGRQGDVRVQDVPEMLVLSLGCRGRMDRQRVQKGLERLEAWLAEHPEYEAAGPVRSMGYNSPMVPAFRRYFEVQIPLRRVNTAPTASF